MSIPQHHFARQGYWDFLCVKSCWLSLSKEPENTECRWQSIIRKRVCTVITISMLFLMKREVMRKGTKPSVEEFSCCHTCPSLFLKLTLILFTTRKPYLFRIQFFWGYAKHSAKSWASKVQRLCNFVDYYIPSTSYTMRVDPDEEYKYIINNACHIVDT